LASSHYNHIREYSEFITRTLVNGEGDSTYCVDGPVGNSSVIALTGYSCSKKGFIATADCLRKLSSFVAAENGCIAAENSVCHEEKTGDWVCTSSYSLLSLSI